MNCFKKLFILLMFSACTYSFSAVPLTEVVIVDVENNAIYMQSQNGSLKALTLDGGQMLWESNLIMKPIKVVDDTLMVQLNPQVKGQLKLAYLAIKEGTINSTFNVSIPNTVNAVIGQKMEESFLLRLDDKDELYWKYSQHNSGAELTGENIKIQYGQLDFNAQNKTLQNSVSTSLDFPKVNKLTSLLTGVTGRQIFSENEQHILVVNNDKTAKNGYYSWQFYDVSGAKLVDFNSHQGYSPFIIVDNYLVYTQSARSTLLSNNEVLNLPSSLIVYGLIKKQVIWTDAIYEKNYRGIVAP